MKNKSQAMIEARIKLAKEQQYWKLLQELGLRPDAKKVLGNENSAECDLKSLYDTTKSILEERVFNEGVNAGVSLVITTISAMIYRHPNASIDLKKKALRLKQGLKIKSPKDRTRKPYNIAFIPRKTSQRS